MNIFLQDNFLIGYIMRLKFYIMHLQQFSFQYTSKYLKVIKIILNIKVICEEHKIWLFIGLKEIKQALIIIQLKAVFSLMKNSSEFEYEIERNQIVQNQQSQEVNRQRQATFLQDYNNLINFDQKVRLSSLAQELKLNNIQYNPLQDHNQFFLHLLHHSKNYRTLTIRVVLGPFTTVLSIFNDKSPSLIHELNCLYGCCGNVYLLEWGSQEKIAIKCIQIYQPYSNIFIRTIKQYTINKIASALRLGPKIIKNQQFDLIMYQKCIQFCMEKCCLAQEYAFTEQDHIILKKKLKTLHELKIVHCDIKPSNLVYSQSYKSPVFLDFGFSKILPTGPGIKVKTKFVGSLQSCCKQMTELYVSQKIGMIDLYYNDAYSLDVAIKSDPIRQTGNDLEEIIKFCDPSFSSFHFTKIFFSLYNDQIFNATNQLLITRRNDKKLKIMNFLEMLPPTQNLRQFYFKFFQSQWKESFQFSDFVRSYSRSHRHQLQLDFNYRSDTKLIESKEIPNIFCHLILHIFNTRINLHEIDNDLINFSESCLGYRSYLFNNFAQKEEKHDFFLSHVGMLNQNYFIKPKQFELSWNICNHFFEKIPDAEKKVVNQQTKLIICFQHLIEYCFEKPLTSWKIRTFRRAICQQMMLKKIQLSHFQRYLILIVNLSCQLQMKIQLLVALIKSLTYQIAIWGDFFNNIRTSEKQSEQLIDKISSQYFRLTSEDVYLEKLIKFDFFLLKMLISKENTIDSIEAIVKSFLHLKQQHCKQRIDILNFIRIMYHYDLKQYEDCRIQIQSTFSICQIPIVLKPQYFLLCNVYYNLSNTKRCKQMFQFIEENIMIKEIIQGNPNISFAVQFVNEKSLFTNWKTKIELIEKPYMYLQLILRKYFYVKNKRTLTQQSQFHQIILSITKDPELISYLQKSSYSKPSYSDKVCVYERILLYYQRIQTQYDKQESEMIRQNYTLKLQLKCHWLKNQYSQIIQLIEKGKLCKYSYLTPIQNNSVLFDLLIKAYLMLYRMQKVKLLIRPIQDSQINKVKFIEKWIGTITFIVLFQSRLQKSLWNEFRDLLLAIVDFIDIHPAKVFINSYILCLRFAFRQKIDIAQIDNGLSTIEFPRYQWKYPLLSFFHIEALIKMVNIQEYLNKRELKLYMWRITLFLPFLRINQLKWVLQQYYPIALKMSQKQKYKKNILLRCRNLINYIPHFKKNHYFLKQIKLLQNSSLMEIILAKKFFLDEDIEEQNGTQLSDFSENDLFFNKCKKMLEEYHKNTMNLDMKDILKNYELLMRLKIEDYYYA